MIKTFPSDSKSHLNGAANYWKRLPAQFGKPHGTSSSPPLQKWTPLLPRNVFVAWFKAPRKIISCNFIHGRNKDLNRRRERETETEIVSQTNKTQNSCNDAAAWAAWAAWAAKDRKLSLFFGAGEEIIWKKRLEAKDLTLKNWAYKNPCLRSAQKRFHKVGCLTLSNNVKLYHWKCIF